MTTAQRQSLHDLYAVVARTDAATPGQRQLAARRARALQGQPMSIDEMIRRTFGG